MPLLMLTKVTYGYPEVAHYAPLPNCTATSHEVLHDHSAHRTVSYLSAYCLYL